MKRIRDWFEALAPREKRLVLAFGALLALFVLGLVPYLTSVAVGSRRDQVQELRAAINAVQASRDKIAERQSRRDAIASRYANRAPALAGFIESAAHQINLEIPESQDLADVPHGKHFTERATVVRLRKAAMLPLIKLFEKIESSNFPVEVSKLHIRKRGGEPDSYDVELTVSAFDQTAAAAAAGAATSTPGASATSAPKSAPKVISAPAGAHP